MHNPYTIRFQIGKSYRLHTSPDFNRLRGGHIVVRAELKPTDQWGTRILLVDAYLDPKDGKTGATELHLGSRCFVEDCHATLTDSFGSHTKPAEVATLQGVYPDFAKAYSVDEIATTPTKAA